jgi:AraC-like DNA-binding protein
MHYVREQKINRARFLLTYSNATITTIAEQLGFYSQSHFSALFKRYAGCYPTEFRGRSE